MKAILTLVIVVAFLVFSSKYEGNLTPELVLSAISLVIGGIFTITIDRYFNHK